MCEESDLVLYYRNLQSGPNKFLDTHYLATKDQLINLYPQVYLQAVFHYFRFDLEVCLQSTIKSVTMYLNDFGWLPLGIHKLRKTDQRAAEMERLFIIFRENDFYRTNANSLSDRSEDEVEIAFSRSSSAEAIAKLFKPSGQVANQIAIPIYGTGASGGLLVHFGDLYNYLKNRMDLWQLISKQMRQSQHAYLNPESIYQIRTSFALTLYKTFLHHVEQIIPWFMDEIGRPERMPSLIQAALNILNQDQSALEQTIRFAFGVLRQSTQMGDPRCTALPDYCLTYLKRIRLFNPAWNITHLNQIPKEFAQLDRHYRTTIDRELLPQGWSYFMQQFNIVPSVDKLTNGVLVDLFMDTINSERNRPQAVSQQQPQRYTEFDVRNQIIWFVALVPAYFRSLHKALFPGLPLPCNYPWYP